MTLALCLNCGEIKFGAICPCPKCQVASTGDMRLDIAFSDHHLAVEKLEELGRVVKGIGAACDEDELRFWSFIRYVSDHEPEILRVDLKPEHAERVTSILARLRIPPPETPAGRKEGDRKPWWRFWK